MSEIYESMRDLDKQIQAIHERLIHNVELAINFLDCGIETERTMPDYLSALEVLRDARKELEG